MKKTKTKKHTYYKVLFYDGDIDIELYPDEDEFEDYDPTDLKQVKEYAQQFKGARILKVTEEELVIAKENSVRFILD